MSTLELGGLILAVEFALLAWGILFVMLRRQRSLVHTDQAHAGAVLEHLENTEVSRRDALANLFETTYRLEGDDLAAKVDEYVAREKAFYSAMLSLYLNRDGTKLQEIPDELAKVLTPWTHMTPTGMIHASEVKSLENEKVQLAAELDNTKNTLEQLMDEYMAAFKKSEPSQPEPQVPVSEPEPIQAVDPLAFDMDEADFDIQPFETKAPEADSLEAAAKPEPEPEPEPMEEPLDPGSIDDLLESLMPSPGDPSPAEPSKGKDAPSQKDIDDALAREELEGLADLFGDPSDKG